MLDVKKFVGRLAVAGLLLTSAVWAGDEADMADTIKQLQAQMQKMQDSIVAEQVKTAKLEEKLAAKEKEYAQNNVALQSQLAEFNDVREAIRANAGGGMEATSLRGAKDSKITIEGSMKIRYTIGSENVYNNAADNDRRATGEWTFRKVGLGVKAQLTDDSFAHMTFRFDRGDAGPGRLLERAYWRWKGICGTGIETSVGLQFLEYTLTYSKFNPWMRVMALDPLTKTLYNATTETGNFGVSTSSNLRHEQDVAKIGWDLAYQWDQLRLTAGVFGEGSSIYSGAADSGIGDAGVIRNNEPRNLGFYNHYASLQYSPDWLDGLHFMAGYLARIDTGQGVTDHPQSGAAWETENYDAQRHGASYSPNFDFGIVYTTKKWGVYSEFNAGVNANFYKGNTVWAWSNGLDYRLTKKLAIGAALEFSNSVTGESFNDLNPNFGDKASMLIYRASLGAKYNLSNNTYVKAQYFHRGMKGSGLDSEITNSDNQWKDADMVVLETGLSF